MKKLKIVTIGGGSSYTPELVEGFIKRHDELPISELWLVDIDEGLEKLEIVGQLAKRMVKNAGLDIEIHLSTNRQEALVGADFVTTQIRVGQLQARALDERIPLSHGYLGQETNGAGGLMKALRTVPLIITIADEMAQICPDAWMINFTNPTGILTQALAYYSKHTKFIGVCNVPIGVEHGVAQALEVPKEELSVRFAGLNHMIYGFDVIHNEKSVFNEALEALKTANITMKNIKDLDWDASFLDALKLIPCPYHRYYYKKNQMLQDELEDFKTNQTRAEKVIKLEEELFELYKDPNLEIKPPQLEKRGGAYYSDTACNLISSIYNDKGDIQTVNTINRGTVSDFAEDDSIEISCKITKNGPIPLPVIEKFPNSVVGLVMSIKQFERMAAIAAYTKDYNTALVALVTNPLLSDDVDGKIILDEMLEANKKYLTGFERE